MSKAKKTHIVEAETVPITGEAAVEDWMARGETAALKATGKTFTALRGARRDLSVRLTRALERGDQLAEAFLDGAEKLTLRLIHKARETGSHWVERPESQSA